MSTNKKIVDKSKKICQQMQKISSTNPKGNLSTNQKKLLSTNPKKIVDKSKNFCRQIQKNCRQIQKRIVDKSKTFRRQIQNEICRQI